MGNNNAYLQQPSSYLVLINETCNVKPKCWYGPKHGRLGPQCRGGDTDGMYHYGRWNDHTLGVEVLRSREWKYQIWGMEVLRSGEWKYQIWGMEVLRSEKWKYQIWRMEVSDLGNGSVKI